MSACGKPTKKLAHSAPCRFHLARARLDFLVRGIAAGLAHHVRQHRPMAARHRRLDLALQHAQEAARPARARSRTCRRAGRSGSRRSPSRARPSPETGWCACRARRRSARPARPCGCARSSSPSPSSCAARHHRAVQVEQHRVAALRDRVADARPPSSSIGVVVHRRARRGACRRSGSRSRRPPARRGR